MTIKTLIAAAAMATLPALASAAVITINDDGATPIGPGQDDIYLFTVDTADGDFNHTFNLTDDGSGTAAVSLTPTGSSFIIGLVASWINADTNAVISSTAVGQGTTTLSTTFADPNSLNQILSITWTGLAKGVPDFEFDGDVSISTVPVPAGLLLMGTALAGLGLTRRKA